LAAGVAERAVLSLQAGLHRLCVPVQSPQVRVDRVDGQAAERVVGSKILRLADRLQAALGVLDVHVVESCVHNVNADKYSVIIAFHFFKEKYFI